MCIRDRPTPEDSVHHDNTRQSAIFFITTTAAEEETANKNYFYSQNPEGNGKTSNQDQDQISSKTTHNKDRERKSVTFSPDIETWY